MIGFFRALNGSIQYPFAEALNTTVMKEETLKQLNLDGLFDLLLLSTKELLESIDRKDEIGQRVKIRQIAILNKVITDKKSGILDN